ncbi:MAG: molybdopterin oxidoreductase family protein [Chloroflexota bacterium]
MTDRIAEPWGTPSPYGQSDSDSQPAGARTGGENQPPPDADRPAPVWPVRVDQYLEEGITPDDVDHWYQSASILTSNGDALDIAVKDGRMVGVRGRASDRVNHGRLDPKDLYAWQANQSPDRLTRPLVRRNGELVETDWDTAMNLIVDRSRELLDEVGPLAFGFYTSGQLMLEEYYTLAVIGKAGLGTPHMDGNTRLCTATAAAALKESFGTDGQPGSYTDVDHADTIALFGHNVAETQSVLWTRMHDRLQGPNPPKLIVVDPRPTVPAREADVHLAIRNGTNLALMNGLLREIIANGWVDLDFIETHTIGFESLKRVVSSYTPERVAEICHVPAEQIQEAARILGTGQRVLSTVLQGFYQSMQASASSVQVNNLHLIRGMIGKPGCGIYQMNGQPSAQNTRETGADGDLPGFRNWDNMEHIRQLAELWNVNQMTIPHWAPPTHAMQIFRFAEQGSIKMLWVSATNPAVSLPDLPRIRQILAKDDLFLVVQDGFLSETAQFADVVLPAAIWGEKTGTFTNVDRTVHISEKALDPPGESRSDLDIFLDYAGRMQFKDKDGNPVIKWDDPESAFEAWKECSRGRPCDYTGMTYEKLRGGSGIQWPCTDESPEGTERLYGDGVFNTDPDYCETWGHDLLTGALDTEQKYRAMHPGGRAIIRATEYQSPYEEPSEQYPLSLTNGRTIYHWHTRTKTARVQQLQNAAPDIWAEISERDAERFSISEGDLVRIESPRGHIDARARITAIRPGVVFLPFHYGYFDEESGSHPNGRPRAANELTLPDWDPVSKQPYYKFAAVRVRRLEQADQKTAAPTTTASAPASATAEPIRVEPTSGGPDADASSTPGEE